jgi:ubiquinone/menaquinone biosynthesis C-methylase UbiE
MEGLRRLTGDGSLTSMMKGTSRFDEAASQWDNNPVRVELARAVGAAIERAVPLQSHWHVLDYGAGTGLLTLCLQPRVGSVLAMDSSSGMLEALSRKLSGASIGNVRPCLWDLERQAFRETGVDLVVSSMTLHHLRDVPLVFGRLAEALNPGGWLAVADLDVEDGSFHGESQDVFHHGFDREQIAGWLGEAGFSDARVGDAHTMTKPDSAGQARAYGVFLATAQKRV